LYFGFFSFLFWHIGGRFGVKLGLITCLFRCSQIKIKMSFWSFFNH
jgi:hypothetical protein